MVYTDPKNKERIEWFLVGEDELRVGISKIYEFLQASSSEVTEQETWKARAKKLEQELDSEKMKA